MPNVARLFRKWLFPFVILCLTLLQFFRLTGPLNEPHFWRQADTANYALDIYRFSLNPFQPMVCWIDENLPDSLKSLSFTPYAIAINSRHVGLLYWAKLGG
ncbi:hypothetical protein L0156_17580 [bacterium]|nr:hypothetical protein [bacterium]